MSRSNTDQSKATQQNVKKTMILQSSNKQQFDGELNDVTIEVGKQNIPANRKVLSGYSKFFESMFLLPFKEQGKGIVALQELDGNAVKDLIEFMYTGELKITTENVMTLISTSDFLDMENVKNYCFDCLLTMLNASNSLEIFLASTLYSALPLVFHQVCDYISDNFEAVGVEDDFMNTSKHDLISIVSQLGRNKVKETSVYSAILKWVKYDECRQSEFTSLFLMLDLHKLPSEFVEDVIAEEELVKKCKICLNAVVSYFINNAKEQRKVLSDTKIVCVGGLHMMSVLEVYNNTGEYTIYPDLPLDFARHCAVRFNNWLYVIGGAIENDFKKTTNKAYRIDLSASQMKWNEVTPLLERRCDFGAAVHEGCLVVAGGFNGSTLNTVEVYNEKSRQWKNIASLNRSRSEHSLVSTGTQGSLFAIGGWDKNDNKSVERLDKLDENWKEVQPMINFKRNFASVYCNGFIYVIGGLTDDWVWDFVEKYNLTTNQWSFACKLNAGRWRHSACVFCGKIFVVGGEKSGYAERKIESYDASVDQWTIVDVTKKKFYDHTIVSL